MIGDGPIPAKVMIVGEAPGEEEERTGRPFVGVSGQELNRMLQEAGVLRSECYVTNVCRQRPQHNDIYKFIAKAKKDITPAHKNLNGLWVLPVVLQGIEALDKEIELVQPNVVVPVGNLALWALTGHWGITKWRGSLLSGKVGSPPPKVIPTIHPAAVLREWAFRPTVVQDLRRVKRHMYSREYEKPSWNFLIRPTFEEARRVLVNILAILDHAPLWLDFDLETKHGHIDCAGLSWSSRDAICIPFLAWGRPEGYWSLDEEAELVYLLWRVLRHPNVKVRGQNLLYDAQYTMRHWHFSPRVAQDTMISWHSAYSGMRKSLDFQASLLCEWYVQWKPDKAAWKEGG